MSDRLDQLAAAILVGGFGTRLRSIRPGHQKVIAPVAGRPFLFRLLDQVADAGLKRVVLCTGYKADHVAATIGESYRDMHIRYSVEIQPLGTAGALRLALPDSELILAMNGDSFCGADLQAMYAAHNGPATIAVREIANTVQSGRVEFDSSGVISKFSEKGEVGPGWINAGIYLLSRAVLESIPAGRAVSIERETFPAWVGRGLRAFPTSGRFLDIGTPESYSAAQEFFQ